MKTINFAKRCFKEIVRDPITLFFGLAFPLILLLLLSAIQANIPVELFIIDNLAPGICVFGLSFMTLFSANLIAKDKESEFLQRLYTTPMKSYNFILGYLIPLIPLSMLQSVICFLVSFTLGLDLTINIVYAVLLIIPIVIFFISLGLLCGGLLNVKQVGGICGALVTNVSAWLSGIWFDIKLVGDVFYNIAKVLPFVHAVEYERAIVNNLFNEAIVSFLIVCGYAIIITLIAIVIFLKQMKKK